MDNELGKEAPINKSRGMEHDYQEMILDSLKPVEVTVDMIDYIKTAIAEMPNDMEGNAKPLL